MVLVLCFNVCLWLQSVKCFWKGKSSWNKLGDLSSSTWAAWKLRGSRPLCFFNLIHFIRFQHKVLVARERNIFLNNCQMQMEKQLVTQGSFLLALPKLWAGLKRVKKISLQASTKTFATDFWSLLIFFSNVIVQRIVPWIFCIAPYGWNSTSSLSEAQLVNTCNERRTASRKHWRLSKPGIRHRSLRFDPLLRHF